MQKVIVPIITLIMLSAGCSQATDAEKLADGICECAQPIVQWRAGLQKDPTTLSKGNAIKMQVDSCLDAYSQLYLKNIDKKEFLDAVRAKVNETCPESSGSVNAIFQMLKEK